MTPLPPELEALMPEPYDGMPHHEGLGIVDGYTADQVREAIKAATERAATICEDMANALSQEWRAGHKISAHLEGQSDGAFDCATAIRGGGREG